MLLDDVCRMWKREWLDEFWRVGEEGRVALLLGKGLEGICNTVMEDASLYCIGRIDGGREGSNYCVGRLLLDIGPSLSSHLLEQLDTVYSFKLVEYLLFSLPFTTSYMCCGGRDRLSKIKIKS